MARANRKLDTVGTDNKVLLAYLAGLFDAEGHLRICKNPHDKANYTLECGIGQSNKAITRLIYHYFGGHMYSSKKLPNRKQVWQWRCSCRYAFKFVNAIMPYLISKKNEAQVAIDFQSKMITTRVSKVTNNEIKSRERQRVLMQKLKNKKSNMSYKTCYYNGSERDMHKLDKVSKLELAYIAGFFDGEGTITIARNNKHSTSFFSSCGISQVDRQPLDFIASVFGGSVYPKNTKHKSQWTWSSSTRYTLIFLNTIYPYLIIKKKQARVAISFQTRLSSFSNGHRVSTHELETRKKEKELLHSLKKESLIRIPSFQKVLAW